jgi:hypothetical protein
MKLTYSSDQRSLLKALALIESGDNPKARGDVDSPDGPALGPYQIHQHAWNQISDWRAKHGLDVRPYHTATDPQSSKYYALSFLTWIQAEFLEHHHALPSPQLLYACYSLGPAVIPKIRHMKGLTKTSSPFEPSMLTSKAPTTPLTSVGYAYALARRKMATGQRYTNLLDAHHQSIRDVGIPLLWE